jgi:hypothetical protein
VHLDRILTRFGTVSRFEIVLHGAELRVEVELEVIADRAAGGRATSRVAPGRLPSRGRRTGRPEDGARRRTIPEKTLAGGRRA